MPYVMRDPDGRLIGLSLKATALAREWVEADDPGLKAFIGEALRHEALARGELSQALEASDHELMRVVEDLARVLIERGLIRFTDLPLAARTKLVQRLSLRRSIDSLRLIDDEHGLI